MSIFAPGASPKSRPILFSAPMIRALLEGRKTQTRRIVKKPPAKWKQIGWGDQSQSAVSPPLHWCPYGKPGDLLWVRENIVQSYPSTMEHSGEYTNHWGMGVKYIADGAVAGLDGLGNNFRSRPSIHMPRWASRLTLELTEVRVERLQDISEADKAFEGGTPDKPFGTVWRAINTAPGIRWEDNPWVWALTFKVHQCNVDALPKRAAA